jgi:uncharacterized protein YecE (DUF72 family)
MTGRPGSGRGGAPIHLGTQGWDYPAWVGPFYPAGTRPHDYLSLYGRAFDTVEIDSTYHATPAEHVVTGWAEKVPAGFHFALKLPQDLSPEARPPEAAALAAFAARALLLGPKLGPVLVQLRPEWGPEGWGVVEAFLASLPPGLRWAIEFRHRGWVRPQLLELLGRYQVALALVEGRWLGREQVIDLAIRPTTDFAYVRWVGAGPRIEEAGSVQVNRDRELSVWAVALAALAARVTVVYGYFANQFQGHAPASVREMERLIGRRPVEPADLGSQTSLF